ncbi:MAG: carboxypeptidase-like regulatory domain-containing protein [Acidobacteriota bacterium]
MKVSAGGQLEGLDIRLLTANASRIAGTLKDPTGEPLANQVVNLDVITRTVGGALSSSGFGGQTRTDARGGFEFAKLTPGEYEVIAGGPSATTAVRVIVDGSAAKRVALIPKGPTAARGSIVSEDGTPLPFSPTRLHIDAMSGDPTAVLPRWGEPFPQPPKADGTFQIPRLDGSYVFRVSGLPDEWMLQGVRLSGRDVTDVPVIVASGGRDVDGLQVILSRRGATIAGKVAGRDGTPAPDLTVIVFAENRARWGVASRFVRAVRADRLGRFVIAGLPAGTYRVAARDEVADGQWEDPEFLDSLIEISMKVELTGGASDSVTLTVDRAR